MLEGRLDRKLGELRIGDKITVNYDDVDGVLVVSRVGRESSPMRQDSVSAQPGEREN